MDCEDCFIVIKSDHIQLIHFGGIKILKDDIFSKINCLGESNFSIAELFDPQEWAEYPIQERRGVGRWAFYQIDKGLWNKDGWIVEQLPNTNPQRYRKRLVITSLTKERVFLNEIPGIEQTVFKDCIKILDACGKWLEIVDKPL